MISSWPANSSSGVLLFVRAVRTVPAVPSPPTRIRTQSPAASNRRTHDEHRAIGSVAIHAAQVLTLNDQDEVHTPGMILVEDGQITYVGAPRPVRGRPGPAGRRLGNARNPSGLRDAPTPAPPLSSRTGAQGVAVGYGIATVLLRCCYGIAPRNSREFLGAAR